MKLPKYPNDFFDYSQGINVNDYTINEWIKHCVQELEQDPTKSTYQIGMGNTFVQVDRVECGAVKYEVRVAKNYWEEEIYFEDLIE